MWQEARKQEKHIKTLMVDYKRRAERRRDYYERIKQDPIKFLRVFGRSSKLHLDSEVTKAAENPNNMMPWIGDPSIMIDRFDVRAGLENYDTQAPEDIKLSSTERIEARLCNYERYRCLIHNEFASVTEAMALKQIEMDEKYGDLEKRRKEDEEAATKKTQESKSAIGFVYEDSTCPPQISMSHTTPALEDDSGSEDEADSDMDIDVELDASTLTSEARRQLAKSAALFGLHPTDFVRLLNADQQLETELRLAKALEDEKLQLSGRKSRRSRRILRERRAQEKFPRLLTTKIGLLNGQPISRRTVYLSASSSDSAEYPSDVEEQDFSGIVYGSPTSKAATIRDQRARAKPVLSNARGPAVHIGGMTSISLCRRNYKQSSHDNQSKYRASSGRTSSSSSSGGGGGGGSRRSRRFSSSSSNRSFSNRGSRSRNRRPKQHSRVEYITTFGDNDDNLDDQTGNGGNNQSKTNAQTTFDRGCGLFGANDSKPPGSAASAVAASVVSKLLSSKQTSEMQIKSSSDNTSRQSTIRKNSRTRSPPRCSDRRRRQLSKSRYRSTSRSRSSSRRSHSSRGSRNRRRDHSRSRRSNSSRDYRGCYRGYRRGSGRYRSRRRSSSSRKSYSSSSTSVDNEKANYSRNRTQNSLGETEQTALTKQPSPPIRKRYYRPELESADELEFSDEDKDDDAENNNNSNNQKESSKSSENISGRRQSTSWKLDSSSYGCGDYAGKMMTSQQSAITTGVSGPSPSPGHVLKCSTTTGSTPRLMPQELLKRRVQSQLTKAFNADKKAEMEKQLQLEAERQAREESLRQQARLLRRQEEKRLRAERRAMALELGSVLGDDDDADITDSSSVSSSNASSSRHRSSRVQSSRRCEFSPIRRRTTSVYSTYDASTGRRYSPPSFTRSRSRTDTEKKGLLGSPSSGSRDDRLPSPPPPPVSSSNPRSSFNDSSNWKRDVQGSASRDRTGNSLLGSPVQCSYYSAREMSLQSPSSSRPDRRYNSYRSSLSSRDSGQYSTTTTTDNSYRPNHQSSYRRCR
uniref:Suppressor of white apricot N-terminal domain-containing protein n=2 Tax=Trichobilharzia regenti TaxID=157069 RepID=A0AA85JNB9_TRIRE|nr:unnamed protein product [Trichobilharzia regenti]